MSDLRCELVFPTTIFVCDLDDHYREQLIDYTRYCQANSAGVSKTNMNGGWQSADNWLDSPACAELRRDLDRLLEGVAETLNISDKLRIFNSWANVNPTGAYNAAHTHPRNFISGCYYLQTPRDCGNIVFYSPLREKEMIDASYRDFSVVTANNLIYPAVAGRVYLFPSWLQHGVQTNNSPEDRISMSFNVFFDKF